MTERDTLIEAIRRIDASLLRMEAKLDVLTHEATRPTADTTSRPRTPSKLRKAAGAQVAPPPKKTPTTSSKNMVSQATFERLAPLLLDLLMRDNNRYRGCSTAVLRSELDTSADTILRVCRRLCDEGLLRSSKEGGDGMLHRVPMQRDEAVKDFLAKLNPVEPARLQ